MRPESSTNRRSSRKVKSKKPTTKRRSKLLAKLRNTVNRRRSRPAVVRSSNKGTKRSLKADDRCSTPRKKLKDSPTPPTNSPIPKIVIKLPEKYKEALRRKQQLKKVNIRQPAESKSKDITPKALDEQKIVKTKKIESKKAKEPSIQDVLRQFNFIDCLNSKGIFLKCSSFVPMIIERECGNRRYPSKSKCKLIDIPYTTLYNLLSVIQLLILEENHKSHSSLYNNLTQFLTNAALSESLSLPMVLFWNIKTQLFQQKGVEQDNSIVRVDFTLTVEFKEDLLGLRGIKRNSKEVKVFIQSDSRYLQYISRDSRERVLLNLFLISVFIQHYIKQTVKNYQRLRRDKTQYRFSKGEEIYNLKSYTISNRTQQYKYYHEESKKQEVEEEFYEEIDTSHIDYFDIYNCYLPFYYQTVFNLSSIELKPLTNKEIVYRPRDITSRVCVIESTRMTQKGCKLDLAPLSPLLFRLEMKEFSIKVNTVKYIDILVKSLLFNTKQTVVKIQTKPDSSRDSSIISKRFSNSWKQYLNSDTDTETFLFTQQTSVRQVSSFLETQSLFKNGHFICFHYKLVIDETNQVFWLQPIVSQDIEQLRTADVKLGFLNRKTYGNNRVRKVHLEKIFENRVKYGSGCIGGYYLFSQFDTSSREFYETNNCVRYDMFLSKRVWSIVKNKHWLRQQLQTFVSVSESHIKVIFRKWCSKELTRLVATKLRNELSLTETNTVTDVVNDLVTTVESDYCRKKNRSFLSHWQFNSVDEQQEEEFVEQYLNMMVQSLEKPSINNLYSYIADKQNISNLLKSLRTNYSSKLVREVPNVFTNTRDSFKINLLAYDVTNQRLLTETELLSAFEQACSAKEEGIRVIEWCFDTSFGVPEDYTPRESDIIAKDLYKVGVRTFLGVFSDEEFTAIEQETEALYQLSKHSRGYREQLEKLGIEDEVLVKRNREKERRYFNDNTAHHVFNKKKCIRTKMFFNYRYLWTREEMKHKDSKIAHGIRSDPSRIPKWMVSKVQSKLTDAGIIRARVAETNEVEQCLKELVNSVETHSNNYEAIEMNVNSFALNIYHDGSIGLSQHFDDAKRFRANIVSMRLYSDSRLSFDCKYFGCTNGKFTVDMPRGSLQVLDNDSYAGKKVTHCIRSSDMMGKSGVLLLREIQPRAVKEADELLIRQTVENFTNLSLSVE